jgi:hypothetical protein
VSSSNLCDMKPTLKDLQKCGCCAPNWFGRVFLLLVPRRFWFCCVSYFYRLGRCSKQIVAGSHYGTHEFNQVWCDKHIPAPRKNYLGEYLEVEPLPLE